MWPVVHLLLLKGSIDQYINEKQRKKIVFSFGYLFGEPSRRVTRKVKQEWGKLVQNQLSFLNLDKKNFGLMKILWSSLFLNRGPQKTDLKS